MKKIMKFLLIGVLIITVISSIALIVFLDNISSSVSLKDLDKNKLTLKYNNVTVLDNNNKEVSNAKKCINIDNIKEYTKNAFISIEDKEFYTHNGLNYKRIVGAMINNIRSGSFKEGASTISQQLVKNTQLSNEKTIERKIKEMYITQELEKEFSKDEILELYLNNIYFGNSSYGIEEASNNYFGKSTKDLTLAESATLAGIIKSPATYSPIYDIDKCISRRNLVLSEMLKDGYISEDEYNIAISEEISLNLNSSIIDTEFNVENYDYINKALLEASEILNLSIDDLTNNNYTILTYLDSDIQCNAHNIINSENYIVKNINNKECQGLITIIDNTNNSIVAYASNSNYDMSNLHRQPGSAIKPIMVYAPALEERLINPMTKILDEPIDINGYKPNNVGNTFHGYTSVRDCVSYSLNIPAIKIMQDIGIDTAKEYAEKFGVSFSDNDTGYALALGGFTEGMTIDNLTNAYTVFANDGYYKPATCIKEIRNKYGMTIYKDARNDEKIIGSDTAYLMTSILQDGVKCGTSKRLNTINCDIAGKTGTVAVSGTNNNTDAISVAYTNDYSVGCWLGNYTMNSEYNLDSSNNGGTYATSALKDMFNYLNSIKKPDSFEIPNNVIKCKINNNIYLMDNSIVLASNTLDSRYIVEDYFSIYNLPKEEYEDQNYTCELNISNKNNEALLSFNTNKYYSYEIIKVSDNKEYNLVQLDSTNEITQYIDADILRNKKYIYYIRYKLKGSNNSKISNKVEFIIESTPSEYHLNDYTWLFS